MVEWDKIDTVLLDMDGTLLDLFFDNFFWREYLPEKWGEKHDLDIESAKKELLPRFRNKVGTLSWYCVDFWSEQLEVDVMALKADIVHLIQKRPHTEDFLQHLVSMNKHVVMVTNAHEKLIDMKFKKTGIDRHFNDVISAHALGAPKEDLDFWHRLGQRIEFCPAKTVLIDDNLTVLRTARDYGIQRLLSIAKPDSQSPERDTAEFQAITSFKHLLD